VIVGPKEDGLEEGEKEKKLCSLEFEAAGGGRCGVCWFVLVASVRGMLKEQSCLHNGQEADFIVSQGSDSCYASQ
jgi:hypothetical protein